MTRWGSGGCWTVSTAYHGIAGALLERLLEAAAARGLHELYALVLSENADMLAVLREHGEHTESRDASTLRLTVAVAPRLRSI